MKPYRSGDFVIGNRFLIDLSTGEITFHCRNSMQLLAARMPPDSAAAPAAPAARRVPERQVLAGVFSDAGVIDDAEALRMADYLPGIVAALAQPNLNGGCERARQDPFWGVDDARQDGPIDPAARRAEEITQAAIEWRPSFLTDREWENQQRWQQNQERMKAEPSASVVIMVQLANEVACMVYHMYEEV